MPQRLCIETENGPPKAPARPGEGGGGHRGSGLLLCNEPHPHATPTAFIAQRSIGGGRGGGGGDPCPPPKKNPQYPPPNSAAQTLSTARVWADAASRTAHRGTSRSARACPRASPRGGGGGGKSHPLAHVARPTAAGRSHMTRAGGSAAAHDTGQAPASGDGGGQGHGPCPGPPGGGGCWDHCQEAFPGGGGGRDPLKPPKPQPPHAHPHVWAHALFRGRRTCKSDRHQRRHHPTTSERSRCSKHWPQYAVPLAASLPCGTPESPGGHFATPWGGGGGLGPNFLCTKNGPTRFSQWYISLFPPNYGPFGLGGGSGGEGGTPTPPRPSLRTSTTAENLGQCAHTADPRRTHLGTVWHSSRRAGMFGERPVLARQ